MRKRTLLSVLLAIFASTFVVAQSRGTISGRITDQTNAVMAQAKVTATNIGTGATRDSVANSDGLYSFAGLDPGTYDVKAEASGFAPSTKRVNLLTDTTIEVDFSMGVGNVQQTIEVSSEAALVETSQSVTAGALTSTEVQNLPMIDRNFSNLVQLVPGARPAPLVNSNKLTYGTGISIGGGGGRNLQMNVDGLDNRDDMVGGPMMNYSLEGVQEYKVLAHNFGAQYGHTSGAVVQVVTKSGGNQLHGSLFAQGRSDALTATDYFSEPAHGGIGKPPYDREQFGGSFGGALKKDKWFLFGAAERIQENRTATFSSKALIESQALAAAFPSLGINPTNVIPIELRDTNHVFKSDYLINSKHSIFVRWAHEYQTASNDQFFNINTANVQRPDYSPTAANNASQGNLYSIVGSHTWVIGPSAVNTIGFQSSYFDTNNYCNCGNPSLNWTLRNMSFPSIQVGRVTQSTDQYFFQRRNAIKEDYSKLLGTHSLKIGGEMAFYPSIGITLAAGSPYAGLISWFNDPSQILASQAAWKANSAACTSAFGPGNTTTSTLCGPYPQGFQTPGAMSAINLSSWNSGGPQGDASTVGPKAFGAYIQDDWKIASRLTLNLGVRYDTQNNFFNQSESANNRVYQALKTIGSPYGNKIPSAPRNNVSPRIGLAWDIGGKGKDVLRLGYGLFFDQLNMVLGFQPNVISKANLLVLATYTNSGVGAGQLANKVYDPTSTAWLPAAPPAIETAIPTGLNSGAALFGPDIKNPYNQQWHAGYTHAFSQNTIVAVDYTHILGLNDWRQRQLNPFEGAWDPNITSYNTPGCNAGSASAPRRLSCAFQQAFGDPLRFGSIIMYESSNRSQYNETIVHFEQRGRRVTFQGTYTLSYADAFGGIVSGAIGGSGIPAAMNPDKSFGPGEWGPSNTDERHRVVLTGVFNLHWGIQASPIFQAGSARPYNLVLGRPVTAADAGACCVGDRSTSDRAIINGQQVGVNAARGIASYDLDLRLTKSFNLGAETRKLNVFAEIYNLTNKANFGNIYNGSQTSVLFQQPVAYLAGYPASRQAQFGMRFTF